MDNYSGNSGSIQSSSTAGTGDNDQEYDSQPRAAVSSFFAPPSTAAFENTQLSSLHMYSSSLGKFNPNSSSGGMMMMFDDDQQQHQEQINGPCFGGVQIQNIVPNNFLLNNNNINHNSNINNNNNNDVNNGVVDMVWPTKFGNLQPPNLNLGRHINNNHHNNNTQQPPQPQPQQLQQQPGPPAGGGGGPGRNPKKRSRASRRAPTTVMTTDTANFRQMVQEFTGIPAPPFSSAAGFPTRTARLDLFGLAGLGSRTGPGPVLRPVPLLPGGGGGGGGVSAASFQNFLSFQPAPSLLQQQTPPSTVDRGAGGAEAAGGGGAAADQPGWAAVMMNVGGGSENNNNGVGGGGGTLRAEGMLDSWICSSDN